MAWDEQSASTGLDECAALVRSAEALCSGAPELAVQLAQRALAIGTGITARDPMAFADVGAARSLSMRAQAVLAGGLVRVSHYADAVEPAFAALALAEVTSATEFAAAVRLDLAVCAREVGEPVLGGAVLRPVLESDVRPSVRAFALSRLVTCVGHLARRDDLEDALAEADRLVSADDRLSPDARRVERARLSVRTAAYHRWYGDTEDAVAAAKAGLGLLNRLRRELRAECDRLRARLVLELVCALLDEGELAEAESAADLVLGEPVRATSAAAVGQLMLAVSTRVLLPSGQVGRGREMLAQSVWMAERHGLDALLADSLTEVSHLDEQAGRTADALEALRSARAAEQRRVRAVARASRMVLTEVGSADVGAKAVTSLLRQASRSGHTVPAPHATAGGRRDFAADAGSLAPGASADVAAEETPDLLNRDGLIRRLRSVRNGERPVALTLLRFEPVGETEQAGAHRADIDLSELAGRVRAIAPDNAELASAAGDELAVILPHTTHAQAERFAATIRETARATDWPADKKGNDLSISTGVVQSAAPTADDESVDAGALLSAARHALDTSAPAAEPRIPRPTRLHAAGTTPADRDPTPRRAAASQNTVGTRSGYFQIPITGPAETARDAAASASEAADTAREAAARSAGTRRRAQSADTPFGGDEEPTRPLPNVAGASESLTVGRAILSSLTIPKGSGGKRRAPGENTANTVKPGPEPTATDETPGWPAPRTAGDQEPGWPRTPGPRSGSDTGPDWPTPPWSTTEPDPQPATDQPASGQPASGQPAIDQPAIDQAAADQTAADEDKRSAYEQTKAELARMMSELTAGGLETPNTTEPDKSSPAEQSPTATIPSPPDPDPIPEPPRGPEIPEPPDPDPIPPTPDEPRPDERGPLPASEQRTETATTSALRAALEPFGGGTPDDPRSSRPSGPATPSGPDWSTSGPNPERSTPADPTPPPATGWSTNHTGPGEATATWSPGDSAQPTSPATFDWSAADTPRPDQPQPPNPTGPPTPATRNPRNPTGPHWSADNTSPDEAPASAESDTAKPDRPTSSAGSDWSTDIERPDRAATSAESGSANAARSGGSAGVDWSADIERSDGAAAPAGGETAKPGGATSPTRSGGSTDSDWSITTRPASPGSGSSSAARSGGSAGVDWSADIERSDGAAASDGGDAAKSGGATSPAQSGGSAGSDWSTATKPTRSETVDSAGVNSAGGDSAGVNSAGGESVKSGGTPRTARETTAAAIDWAADILRSDGSGTGERSITEPAPGSRSKDTPGGRRDRSDSKSTTIAGLLAEALAAYQSTADDEDDYRPPPAERRVERHQEPGPLDTLKPFDTGERERQAGVHGRHRSPE